MKPKIIPVPKLLSEIECGEDVWIAETAYIRFPHLVKIGSHCAIDHNFYCTAQLELEDYVHIAARGLVIGGKDAKLTIMSFAEVSPNVSFICGSDAWNGDGLVSPLIPAKYRDKILNAPILLEPFSGAGTGSIIMPGVTLHRGAVLAANSFANKDIPAWQIWGGNPAKFIKNRPHEKMERYAREMGYEGF